MPKRYGWQRMRVSFSTEANPELYTHTKEVKLYIVMS